MGKKKKVKRQIRTALIVIAAIVTILAFFISVSNIVLEKYVEINSKEIKIEYHNYFNKLKSDYLKSLDSLSEYKVKILMSKSRIERLVNEKKKLEDSILKVITENTILKDSNNNLILTNALLNDSIKSLRNINAELISDLKDTRESFNKYVEMYKRLSKENNDIINQIEINEDAIHEYTMGKYYEKLGDKHIGLFNLKRKRIELYYKSKEFYQRAANKGFDKAKGALRLVVVKIDKLDRDKVKGQTTR